MFMIIEQCEKIGLCKDAVTVLSDAFDAMFGDDDKKTRFMQISQDFLEGKDIKSAAKFLAGSCQIDSTTVYALIVIHNLPSLEKRYKQWGFDADMYKGVLDDLHAKVTENKNSNKVWGIRTTYWYPAFFAGTRVCLGRLQFEKTGARYDFDDIKAGDTVINVHIPSTGPLLESDVLASFEQAYNFFSDTVREDGLLTFVCSSWILHKPTAQCYKEGSNLEKFYSLFKIVYNADDEENKDFWRVFNCNYADRDRAPSDTTLRKNILTMINNGQSMGTGYGVMYFDGKKICRR